MNLGLSSLQQKSRHRITHQIIVNILTEELYSTSKEELEFRNMPKLPLKIAFLLSLEMSVSTES